MIAPGRRICDAPMKRTGHSILGRRLMLRSTRWVDTPPRTEEPLGPEVGTAVVAMDRSEPRCGRAVLEVGRCALVRVSDDGRFDDGTPAAGRQYAVDEEAVGGIEAGLEQDQTGGRIGAVHRRVRGGGPDHLE